MEWYPEQPSLPTSTPILDDISLFVDAIKSLLDESDITTISMLAKRLSPFRIHPEQVVVGNTVSVKPVLVLECEQRPCNETQDHIAQSYLSPEASWNPCSAPTKHSSCLVPTTSSAPYEVVPSAAIPNDIIANGIAGENESGIAYPQSNKSTDYAEDMACQMQGRPMRQERVAASVNNLFQACIRTPVSTRDHRSDDKRIYNEVSQTSSHNTPNTGTVPYEENRDGDVSEDPRDRQSEMIETIQTLQSTNPEGDFMIMELTRSSTTTLDAQYGGLNTRQARKDNKVRRRRSSASSRVVSSATSFCSTSHFTTNNGANPVAETAGLLVDTPAFKAISAARTSIRTDYFRFLEINLGRWAQGGLWQTSGPLDQTAGMNIILENAHPEWTTANSRQKAELRAKFHDQKRFGKRWWMLVDVLGPSILIICSSRFAGTINNTTVTTDMIKAIIRAIRNSKTSLMAVFETVNPIADSLLRNQEYGSQDVDQLLKSLRSVRLDWVGGEDDLL
ncbi:Aurovertin biosynthesis cluster transcription factor aurF [Metarhizium brunneum]|uniref:Aurovertin biosynthesis cluster transcription factor aurF n=1 Tax=Metarhizium brunneum TaxID=500148 RepID=A0A7D5V3Y6_9HYPO|nr:Aurovertin biosynthesis cluster transcription factor aurF [Metarhizium brunneum]